MSVWKGRCLIIRLPENYLTEDKGTIIMGEYENQFGNIWENAQIPYEEAYDVDAHNIMKPSPQRIMKITHEDEAEFTFQVYFKYASRHGQFCMLSLPRFGEIPIFISGRGEDWIEFTIQKVTQLTDSLFKLREGDLIYLRGPFGRPWPLEKFAGASKHLVILAPETGITAVRTITGYFHSHPEELRSLYLISSFKDEKGILFRRELGKWNTHPHFHLLYTLTDAFSPGFGAGPCLSHLKDIPFASFGEDYHIAIAGPQQIMRETAEACLKMQIPEEKIWICLERKMYCAAGKCGHCKINETYVCLEGPVFPYTRARLLFD